MVSAGQLAEAGLSHRQVEGWVASGRLHRLHRGVYAVGHTQLVNQGHLIAALLAVGPKAFLSHRTAAAVWGLRAVNLYEIELTVSGSNGGSRDNLRIHRTTKPPHRGEVITRTDLRVASVPRLLIELANREDVDELQRLITAAVRKRAFNRDAVEGALHRHRRRPGTKGLQTALAGYRPADAQRKSDLELAFGKWLRADPQIPDPQHNVQLGIWEIDFWWPQFRLAVELDGRDYHTALRDRERDNRKDADLQLKGINVVRISDTRFELDLAGIRRDLYAFMGPAA